ncbi:hypothetical protein TMatcc_002551 [Talaromyces marneffei ATCC 18224]
MVWINEGKSTERSFIGNSFVPLGYGAVGDVDYDFDARAIANLHLRVPTAGDQRGGDAQWGCSCSSIKLSWTPCIEFADVPEIARYDVDSSSSTVLVQTSFSLGARSEGQKITEGSGTFPFSAWLQCYRQAPTVGDDWPI